MTDAPTDAEVVSTGPAFLAGGGVLGAMMRACNWAATPLGAPAIWPTALRMLTEVILGFSQPMFVVWGPERTLLYNDPYAEILAGKNPAAPARPFLDVWSEIRADLVPIVEQAGMAELIRRTVGPGIAVELRMGDGSWLVQCDPSQLENALLNLAINARDAMPEGGTLTVGTGDVRLDGGGRGGPGGRDALRVR